MVPDEHSDRLVDTLLEEIVGGQGPPDLSGAVVRAAFGARRLRRALVAAAAAAAVLAVASALLWRRGYPAPQASGALRVVGGGPLRRGATVRAGEAKATLTLGGYCRIDIEPASRVRIEGKQRDEAIFLGRGGVLCDVDRQAGEFTVRTEVGSVSALGTRFLVRLLEEKGGQEMARRRMLVRVMVGAVVMTGAWGQAALAAGQEKTVPAKKAPAAVQPAPQKTVRLSHVDDSAEGRRSIGGSGHAVEFERPEGLRYVEAVLIHGARYGYPRAPQEDFHVYLLDEQKQVLKDVPVPYGTIARGNMRWYTLQMPSVEVPKRFWVALSFNPTRTKGVYLGMDQNVQESHSYIGLPGRGFQPVGERADWMVRVVLTRQPKVDLELPPCVVETFPFNRARDVDPRLREIKVTFDRPMTTGKNWSWILHTRLGAYPGYKGSPEPRWEDDGRTCVLAVRLRPNTVYAIGVNGVRYTGFRDRRGRVAVPYVWVFKTGKLDRGEF